MECGQQRQNVKALLLQRCALHKFYVTNGRNMGDQITSGRRVQTHVIKLIYVHSIQS